MDADRDRPGADGGRPGLAAGPDPGRRAGRRCALRARGRGRGGDPDRHERAGLRDLPDLSRRAGRGDTAGGRKLRPGAGHRGDQPGARRPRRDRRALRPQCALRVDRRGAVRGGDGRLRLLLLSPGGVLRDRGAARPHAARAARRRRGGNRSRARARQPAGAAHRQAAGRSAQPAQQARLAGVRLLHPAVPSRQCRHAAAHGQRAHHALEPVGHRADRRLHGRPADRGRAVLALGRPARRSASGASPC